MLQCGLNCRAAIAPAALITQNWLVDRFESFGLDVFIQNFPCYGDEIMYWGTCYDQRQCVKDAFEAGNVIAIQSGAVFPEQYIIVFAHYDHNDGPGADDNASGTAAVLEIARILSQHQFKRSIIYVPLNAEEYGLIGSKAYAEKCAEEDMDIIGCFNMDMIGYFPEDIEDLTMYFGASYITERLAGFFQSVVELYVPEVPARQRTIGDSDRSDHASFNAREYPALSLSDLEHTNPCYHQPCDTLGDGLNNLGLTTAVTKAVLASVAELADGWFPPQFLSAMPFSGAVNISWDKAPDTEKYRIFKNDILLKETTSISYVDKEVKTGEKYIYYVTGVHKKTKKESLISNKDSLIFSPPLALPFLCDFEENTDDWFLSPSWYWNNWESNSGDYSLLSDKVFATPSNYLTIAELNWFSIPDTATNITFSFYLKGRINNQPYNPLLGYLEITTDRKTWKKIGRMAGDYRQWDYFQYSLNEYIGEPFVQIRFRLQSSGSSNNSVTKYIFLDDVKISFKPMHIRPVPQNVRIASFDAFEHLAVIEWDVMDNITGFNVYKNGSQIRSLMNLSYYKDKEAFEGDCYQVSAIYNHSEESGLSEAACTNEVGMESIILSQLKINPNPSTGIINVSTGLSHPYTLTLYNIQGIKVFHKDSCADREFNLSHLPKGIYIITITTAKESISKKIILQ